MSVTMDAIYRHKDVILTLLSSTNAKGKKLKYYEILETIGIEGNPSNVSALSSFARQNDFRRRGFYPRREHVTTEITEKTISLVADKEKFIQACKAFADIYFGE